MLICGVEWCWICRLQHVVRTMQWALHHLRLANYVLWQSGQLRILLPLG